MDRFEDLRCFVQVVDLGSVTRAADALSIAPSAVSRRIKELEARLGAQLLTRTTRRMSLTEAGQGFHARAQAILRDLAEAEAEAGDAHGALTGLLRVAAPLTFGTRHLSGIIADFAADHPGVDIDIDLSDRLVDLVGEGFDLGIRIGTLRESSLVARKLVDIGVAVIAAPRFLAQHGMPRQPDDLRALPALCYVGSERADIWRYRGADGSPGAVQVKPRMRSGNGEVLRDAAIAGLGVALQPWFIVDQAVARGDLQVILAHVDWPPSAAYAVYPATRHLSAKARAFIDFVRRRLADTCPGPVNDPRTAL